MAARLPDRLPPNLSPAELDRFLKHYQAQLAEDLLDSEVIADLVAEGWTARRTVEPDGTVTVEMYEPCPRCEAKVARKKTPSMPAKPSSTIRYISFPNTEPPADHVSQIVDIFRVSESQVCTQTLAKGLTSNAVLSVIRPGLIELGFAVEGGKTKADKIERPVFYGENGRPALNYQIDAYHAGWKCGLEVEAGRAWMGNAIYRDLVQAMVMVQVDHLCLAVPNAYKYTLKKSNKLAISTDFDNAVAVAQALFAHTRVKVPYRLTLIGY